MKVSQLRDLTRKYANGQLGREEYLAERERLIGGVVAGQIELHYRELTPVPQHGAPAQKHWLFIGGSIMLVGLLLIALLAYFVDDGPTRSQAATANGPAAVENPGAKRLSAFMSAGDWSEDSLARLERDWQGLSAFQRQNARRSATFQRLKYETSQRITEQEALLAAGEMEALLYAARLREFADRMGIPRER